MASDSTAQTQRVDEEKETCEPKSSNSSKSCFQPTVCLKDWWLIRAETDSQGRTLAVAGLTSREGQALRGFTSAPILKIYDVFNLETIDGVCVVLKGFINKSRSEENDFPSEVIEQFLFGFPPQWETFNEKCLGRESKEVKDLKKLDQKDHVETTGETIQDHNGRQDYEVEDNLMRDNQNDGEVASEVIIQKATKRATRSSVKLNSTNTSTSIAKKQTIQDHNGRQDYEVEDNLMRDNQNDGEVASEVIVQKKTKRATRSLDKLNSTNTSTSIAKEQTIQDHNGRKDYEVEDNLMRDNENDGEVASEVIVQKKTKRAMRSSDKLNSTNTSTSIAKEQTADDNRTTHFKSSSASTKNAKRKLSYGSPQQGEEAVPLISPEPLSFNRSRSGRVLLPPMAFWRNQRAVYDADQRVTEVQQGDLNLDNISRVCRSEPSKERRKLR
ncbi:kinetochore-associated protein KNL-2 homolog isoform X2 [Solanum dulcamara]|uniref:kinetochore-associated protein KNL-2 homolog isoform X2 n=1 Tax=Solanum dulcamara TaxID=45834 RepID=UPI00248523F6|nr:kinetochore-associated protein KNL-2 homolog isoform X2 [Solanum dulcamara]